MNVPIFPANITAKRNGYSETATAIDAPYLTDIHQKPVTKFSKTSGTWLVNIRRWGELMDARRPVLPATSLGVLPEVQLFPQVDTTSPR